MRDLPLRHQFIISFILISLMALTRGHHFASLSHLPSATLAIFFIAGFYISSRWLLVVLLAEAALLDFAAITWGGVSSFCVSPAYALLLPAYGTLYLAGNWYRQHYQFTVSTLLPLMASLLSASVISQLFSSGGFYVFSGRYAEPTLIEFSHRFITYYPAQLANLAFYITITALCHLFIVFVMNLTTPQQRHHS